MRKIAEKIVIGVLLSIACASCSDKLFGETCMPDYIMYRYRNSVGVDTTKDMVRYVSDFIFTKDSILYRVDEKIGNGSVVKRPINLPDGEWIIASYGNLNSNSSYPYVVGKTRLSEMAVRVISQPTYKGTYAESPNTLLVGDADRLYYSCVKIKVRNGRTDGLHWVDISNVHIWLSATIKWVDSKAITYSTRKSENLHIRLETVPVEQLFVAQQKLDPEYNIPYQTPQSKPQTVSHISKLYLDGDGNLTFNTYGLRWESGKAPVLKFYDGETLLINKELDLNKYFESNKIDLTNSRVQFYNLLIIVDGDNVSISTLGFADWETGYLN